MYFHVLHKLLHYSNDTLQEEAAEIGAVCAYTSAPSLHSYEFTRKKLIIFKGNVTHTHCPCRRVPADCVSTVL